MSVQKVSETSSIDPDSWPIALPRPERPHAYRKSMLGVDTVPYAHLNKMIEQIEYYPEVQIAVLHKLKESPSKGLLAAMATAVAEVIKTPGQSVTDVDRLKSIEAVARALEAAVEFTDGSSVTSRGRPPF